MKPKYIHIRITNRIEEKLVKLAEAREETKTETARYIIEKFFEKS